MAQWTNLQWTKKFANPTRLYISCEKSGGLHLAEPGLRQVVHPADEIWVRLELAVDRNIRFSTLSSRGTALFQHL